MKKNIAILASGAGSNAARIMDYFSGHPLGRVNVVISSSPTAGVNLIARENNVPLELIEKTTYGTLLPEIIKEYQTDLIVLAGFLWHIPAEVTREYDGRIVNIHPSLLPKYGGKGMYGNRVHQAVIDNCELESGITIHLVNDHYDEGKPLLQVRCPVEKNDTIDSLSGRVRKLEHEHFPVEIEKLLKKL